MWNMSIKQEMMVVKLRELFMELEKLQKKQTKKPHKNQFLVY